MRKFYAAIALCITLIGAFAPVLFSVSLLNNRPEIKLQKNIASADVVDVSFGAPISIIESPGKPDYYKLETTVRYDSPTRGTGSPFNNASFFGAFAGSLDPHYTVVNTTTNTTIIDEQVTSPQNLGLKDATWGPMRQEIQITTPGKYEAWFYEDYVTGNNLLSSKIKFEITGNKKVVNAQISSQTGNVRGDDQIAFSPVTGTIDPATPDKASFTVGVTYKNPNKQTTDDSSEDLYWVLKDETGAFIIESPINLTSNPKYNTERQVTIQITNLQAGKKYKMNFIEKGILDTQGNPKRSQEFPFTAGEAIDNDATQQQIQQDNANAAQQALDDITKQQETEGKDGFTCGLIDVFCNIYILIIDFTLFIPNGLTVIAGLFMDISLKIAISPAMYGLSGSNLESGLRTAWTIIRDFSNIGFIFALFVAAFSLIMNKDFMGFEPKKTVVRVVIMALLVNFSFMICRVVIQTGDLFANILYNKITVEGGTGGEVSGISISSLFNALDIKSPSLAIISQINPQKLFMNGIVDDSSFTLKGAATGAVLGGGLAGLNANFGDASWYNPISWASVPAETATKLAAGAVVGGILVGTTKGPSFYITYGIMAVTCWFIYLILIFIFLQSAFIFLGRIVGLWLSIIVSPLAFVGNAIPMLRDNKFIGFDNWLNNLVKLSFLTPIFLFFIYLTAVILKVKDLIPFSGGGLVMDLVGTLMPAIVAAFLMIQGKKISSDMSGAIGEMVGKVSGWATTAALGAATGGTAMLGRQTLGRAGSALANANRGDNSFLGKGMRTMGDKLGAASFDVRKNERAMKGFGKFTEMSGEKIDLGTRGLREGGFVAEGTFTEQYRKKQEEVAKKKEEEQKKAAEKALLDAQAKDAQELRERQAKLEAAKKAKEAEDARIAMEAENQGPEAFIDKKNAEKATEEAALQNLKDEKDVLEATGIQLQIDKATIETEKTTLMSEETDLNNQLSTMESDKASLVAQLAAIPNDGSKISKEEKAEVTRKIAEKDKEIANQKTLIANNKIAIDTKDQSIAEKNKEIADNQKLVDKKEGEINKKQKDVEKIDSYGTHLAGVTSVRDARQKKVDLELEAAHSQEKALTEKNKTEMDKKKTEADEAQAELNKLNTKLKNEKDETKRAQIEADIAEKTAERNKKDTEYNKAKSEHKAAKQRYDDAFGNKITALSDFEKEALKMYEKEHDVEIRKATAQNAVIAAQKDVNASQNNLDNLNYQYQQKYAEDIEKKAAAYQKVFGRMTEHVATATGGLIGGEALNNAGENAATGVRKDVTGK